MTEADRSPFSGRILEIGENSLFERGMPEHTEVLFAGYRADLRGKRRFFGLRKLLSLAREVREGRYALVVLHPPYYAWWHPRSMLAALKFSLFRGRFGDVYGALSSPFYFQMLRFVSLPPMIAIDRADGFDIPRHHHFLLDKAQAFFKRELPVDHWQAFFGSAHRRLPGLRIRMKERWRRRVAKLRPIALSVWRKNSDMAIAAYGAEKTVDVFFAGSIEGNSSVRDEVPAILERLRAAGVTVYQPDRPLPLEDYIRACAASWITLSPAGLGWDCYRHVEAALAGSVPLVSTPTIARYRPMLVGMHCLSYLPDEDRIVEIVTEALADKARLAAMARAAHEHAAAHLTEPAICAALVEEFCGNAKEGKR